jgi:hypothetical protein
MTKTKPTGQGGPGRGQGRKRLPPGQKRIRQPMFLLPRTIRQIEAIMERTEFKHPGRVVEMMADAMAHMLGITEER